MTIDQAKKFFELLFNKYQLGGYTSPKEFNLLADRAQTELYMERYGNPNTFAQGSGTARQGATISGTIQDELKVFLTVSHVNMTPSSRYSSGPLPSNYQHYDSSRIAGNSYSPIKIVDQDKLNSRLISKVVPPTYEFPIGVIIGNEIQVYPKNVLGLSLSYYRKPTAPNWNYTGTTIPVYTPIDSINFEMPDSTHNEIVIKMLSYKGISIREQELIGYAANKDNTGI
jgi:hypothetical protein